MMEELGVNNVESVTFVAQTNRDYCITRYG